MQEELYRRFSPKMYAVCLRYAGKDEDAQDILQDGFVKVFRNLGMYRGDGSFEGWVRRIFVNTAIEHYRRKAAVYPVTETHENILEAKDASVLDTLSVKDLQAIIQQLSPGYKAVFNLYVIEGYTHKEIGDMMGISEGTSKSQLARAKIILQNIIKTYKKH
ncbi:MAG: sigma-70 family RNA polymerase sigma factor [Chitinophagaceae bacterium]|nr:sigma-70 family RNA polymerase sigma factor [Chitinophagaceae bacterium]MCW5927183.1 sigma-70 family RNA polymerase sigma factor [Chitinophagaceae bacterium]